MPQNKKRIQTYGTGWAALRADIVPLAKKHPREAKALIKAVGPKIRTNYRKRGVTTSAVPSREVLETQLRRLTEIAINPNGFFVRAAIPESTLFQHFAVAPELTLEVIKKARKIWFKDSEATRIWRWLANGKLGAGHSPTDDELTTAYIRQRPESADLRDLKSVQRLTAKIVKARAKLVADIFRGMSAAERKIYNARHSLKM